MTKEEAQKFMDKIKGKKIRWSSWIESEYLISKDKCDFIPNTGEYLFEATYYNERGEQGSVRHNTLGGFNYHAPSDGQWEFFGNNCINITSESNEVEVVNILDFLRQGK